MANVAKAELHVHLEGTAPPQLVTRIAARNGVDLPERLLGTDGRFRYTDFLDFLATYDLAASVIRTGQDYRDITYEYLCQCARGGAIYVELTASPDHAALVGLSEEEHLEGIVQGIDEARRDTGIEGRILISAVRKFGVERAVRAARYAAEHPHPYVVGFSMAGDEAGFPAGLTSPRRSRSPPAPASAARSTRASGPGADSVRAALELPITRIAHGVRAIEDPDAGLRARARSIVLDCCPTSNVVLGVFPSYQEHPLPAAARRRGQGHARFRRPPLLWRHDGRRVRGVASDVRFRPDDLRDITAYRDRRRVLRRGPAVGVARSDRLIT